MRRIQRLSRSLQLNSAQQPVTSCQQHAWAVFVAFAGSSFLKLETQNSEPRRSQHGPRMRLRGSSDLVRRSALFETLELKLAHPAGILGIAH